MKNIEKLTKYFEKEAGLGETKAHLVATATAKLLSQIWDKTEINIIISKLPK